MLTRRLLLLTFLLAPWAGGPDIARGAEPLPLKDGDRIVLVGGGLIEQERRDAYLEARLVRRVRGATLRFRNLGWSGDTVTGAARTAGFRHTEEGLGRLLLELRAQAPTVLFLGYGMNESFAGPGGLAAFRTDFNRLLDQLSPLGSRLVILSPTPHEDLGRPLPDPAEHNRSLEQYTAVLRDVAERRRLPFVDLFHSLATSRDSARDRSWTTNGLLPNRRGYWRIAREVENQLLGAEEPWRIELDASGKVLGRRGAEVARVRSERDGLRFDLLPATLPAPPPPPPLRADQPVVRVRGLAPGRSVLKIGGREAATAGADEWARGVAVCPWPAVDREEELRSALAKQGELFYRRWRPFNDFVEHWGYIERDFKAYDDLIAAQDAVIARLRRPVVLACEMVPAKGGR